MRKKRDFILYMCLTAFQIFLLSGCALLNLSSENDRENQIQNPEDGGERTPRQTVEEYYDWYLDYLTDADEDGSLLMDALYNQSDYLTQSLIQDLEISLLNSSGEGCDPFLCRKEIPQLLEYVDQPRVGKQASIKVISSIPEYSFIVDLEQIEGEWKISSIHCQDAGETTPLPEGPLPQGAIIGFYDWYLAFAQEQEDSLSAGDYQASEYLAESFVQKVDAIVRNSSQDEFDPFLCAQAIPIDYSVVDVVIEGGIARSVIQTGSGEHTFTVVLSQQEGRWMITDVLCEEGD